MAKTVIVVYLHRPGYSGLDLARKRLAVCRNKAQADKAVAKAKAALITDPTQAWDQLVVGTQRVSVDSKLL